MRLYIIRHGETSWNKAKRLQGRKDIMLDADGIRLAEKTGGNQGWKCIWFGDSLQESYQKGNEESKIY